MQKGLALPLLVMSLSVPVILIVWLRPSLLDALTHPLWWKIGITVGISLLLAFLITPIVLRLVSGRNDKVFSQQSYQPPATHQIAEPNALPGLISLRAHLKSSYSWFTRRRLPWLLVVGDIVLTKQHFPNLFTQGWLDTGEAVFIWAGDGAAVPAKGWRRPADGIVAVTDGAMDSDALSVEVAHLTQACRYALPVQLWLSPAGVDGQRQTGTGLIYGGFAEHTARDAEQVGAMLQQLVAPLAKSGVAAIRQGFGLSFDAALSAYLEQQGPTQAVWISRFASGLHRRQRLCGARFLPGAASVPAGTDARSAIAPTGLAILASSTPVLRDLCVVRPAKLAWSGGDWFFGGVAVCAGLWAVGMTISFVGNQRLLAQAEAHVATLQAAPILKQAWPALLAVQDDLARHELRAAHGVPWRLRFGLDHNKATLAALWQPYGTASGKWLVQPVMGQLQSGLRALNSVPLDRADDDQSGTDSIGQQGYETLKTYLMLAEPKHADAAFLGPRLAAAGQALWPALSPDSVKQMAMFYAGHLPLQPQWKMPADADAVYAARQTLSGLIDVEQAEDTLYHALLANTKAKYPDPTMGSLLGGRDSRGLWSVQGRLPGTFTRQAYDGYVREAILQLSKHSAVAGDWVLGEQQVPLTAQPEELQARLNQRYFTDFAYAWQAFLNRLSWVPEASLAGSAEQLRTYADAQQSPLAALMKTVAWQAQTGMQTTTLADSLVEKAKGVFKDKDGDPAAARIATTPSGPLSEAFGPLVRLVDGGNGNGGEQTLSLQRYLDRVSATRLKLDQVTAATDPDALARQLAQNLFQGRASDLIDARQYAELVAASLGSAYAGMGRNLFLRPLDQSWQTLLQPAAASINQLWQDSVVTPWNGRLGGRYPFGDLTADASLPELARFLQPGSGAIPQFASTQLAGILTRRGEQWEPDPIYAQTLQFDPAFLNALNQLSWLASHLYAEGDTHYRFQLLPIPAAKLIESELLIDAQRLRYFNQKADWQTFSWPGDPEQAGARLSWTSVQAGLRKQDDYAGRWALLRLLATAKVEQIDKANYRLQWDLPDGEKLRYILRTEAGAGPLELLQLRGFKLPQRVFVTRKAAAASAVKDKAG